MGNKVSVPANYHSFKLWLTSMTVGRTWDTPNELGRVTRVTRDAWMLKQNGNEYRARWGDELQIAEDLEYFEANKCLPEPSKVQGF